MKRALSTLIFACAFGTAALAVVPQGLPTDLNNVRVATVSSGMVCGTASQVRLFISLSNQGEQDVDAIVLQINERAPIPCKVTKVAYDESTGLESVALVGIGNVTITRVRLVAIYMPIVIVGRGFVAMFEKRIDVSPVDRYMYF